MKKISFKIIVTSLVWIAVQYPIMAAEYNPQHIDDGVHPILRLAGESMGGFQDAMKSYIMYTAAQHVPGTKESGVGYYYDNKTGRLQRNLFYRMGGSQYPRHTGRTLDLAIRGTGFFVIELPGGDIGYTHDGRFERDWEDGHLKMIANDFPILGEKGYIYLKSDDVEVTQEGVIIENDEIIDVVRVEYVKVIHDLKSFNQAIFYLSKEDYETKRTAPDYHILQGFIEESTITKAYIGLVPEWDNGFNGNVKAGKSYIQNMTSAIQSANP